MIPLELTISMSLGEVALFSGQFQDRLLLHRWFQFENLELNGDMCFSRN